MERVSHSQAHFQSAVPPAPLESVTAHGAETGLSIEIVGETAGKPRQRFQRNYSAGVNKNVFAEPASSLGAGTMALPTEVERRFVVLATGLAMPGA